MNKKLTVLIPYRDREKNLNIFIPYFHSFMEYNFPDIPYEIVIIEQGNKKHFNKGILFNVGYLLTSNDTDYYALHDVDQLPISADYNYTQDRPIHLCVNCIEQGNNGVFKNPYKDDGYQQKGGAIIIDKELYESCNGHSNNYWGWGAIDDDFHLRLVNINKGLVRIGSNNEFGYYLTLNAKTDRFNLDSNYTSNVKYFEKFYNNEIDYKVEGLNTTKFKIVDKIINNNYTKYIIDFENDK